jgi:hypothetical protein
LKATAEHAEVAEKIGSSEATAEFAEVAEDIGSAEPTAEHAEGAESIDSAVSALSAVAFFSAVAGRVR